MRTNYHTHTYRCRHAGGTSQDYVNSAIINKLDILGISDHGPFPDDSFDLRMYFRELEEYIDEIAKLKITHAKDILIYSGLEIEYFSYENDYYKDLLTKYNLDYLVLGQHFYAMNNEEPKNIYFAKSTKDYIDYATSAVEGMKTGFFKFLAHPDLMFINDFPWDKNCEEATDIIISAAKEHDFILEFNANGFRRQEQNYCDGIRIPYPHKNFWSKVSNTDIKVIINTDCHNPNQVWDDYVDLAYLKANELSLNIVNTIF
ncbi:MAG: putative histidinol phosphatase [Clostridiales bacterium]|jgi:histidinol-phosphatase (PHP family)|nr:putative histidinol phosphatase [Clostridiales bacterium]